MPRYEAGPLPDPRDLDSQRLAEYLQQELRRLAGVFAELDQGRGAVLSAAPNKPREGQLVYADGVTWDPGSGEGYYYYDGAAWVFTGGGGGGITAYAPGSFTVATGKFQVMSRHLILTATQRVTLVGNATLRIT